MVSIAPETDAELAAAASGQIDPRSFHVFERDGDRLLFDRATGSTLELTEDAFAVFSRIAEGTSLATAIAEAHPQASPQDRVEAEDAIRALQLRGFLRFVPVDLQEQESFLESLWRHRPRRVQLLMAQGCNLGCRYCYAWRNGSNQKKTLMSWPVAKAAVDHLIRNSAQRTDLQVTFFGGEPLLNLEMIRRVVAYCRTIETTTDKRFLFELITNGTLLTKEVTDWIIAEKFLLFVSIDGWEEMHNYNRPSLDGSNQYAEIVQNAWYAHQRYQEAGLPAVKVRANLTGRFPDAQKAGEHLAALGFRHIGLAAIEPLPHGDPSPSALTEDQMDALHAQGRVMLREALEKKKRGEKLTHFEGAQLGKALSPIVSARIKGVNCGVARNTQVVDNQGRIYPCHRYEGMEAYVIGNVFTGLDRELTMAYYRKVNRNATNRCHSCWIREYCAGGCAWLLSAKDGHIADPTERECQRRRNSMESSIWLRQSMRKSFPEFFTQNGEFDINAWNWGDAEALNDAPLEVPSMNLQRGEGNCSSGCETCGPNGCSS